MKKTGAWLVRYALEQIGVKHTFGIPGVHNTEIYDELNKSESIKPILVTHEGGGAFMADAISRCSDSIGCLMVVPAAGLTHAASGIAEASLDGVPMLVISGGVRTDGMQYQLHDMDQHALMAPITKATYKVTQQSGIVDTIFKAYDLAMAPEQGPVFVEIPVNIGLFKGEIEHLPTYCSSPPTYTVDNDAVEKAAELLANAKSPGIFLGWGAVDAGTEAQQIAELICAPVSTTLQGLSVFPATHPLHTGMGFGPAAVPAAYNAFKDCDCMLAVGTRFSEIPTGSFGCTVPENLIHIDLNPDVFDANYQSTVAIQCDAKVALAAMLQQLTAIVKTPRIDNDLVNQIRKDKHAYKKEWRTHKNPRVNPGKFFSALHEQLHTNLKEEPIVVADDGNHTFLTAELMPIHSPRHFISPTDFNCMGYCVPAAIGAQLANPSKQVVGIVGDGAFLMTGMELITAATHGISPIIFVFSDGELSQISQAQQLPYNRKTCTQLGSIRVEGVAMATGSLFLSIDHNDEIEEKIKQALHLTEQGAPVLVDVKVDYSKKTQFTKGIVATNLKRFSNTEKARFIGRAIKRKVTG